LVMSELKKNLDAEEEGIKRKRGLTNEDPGL
jgi:hypothetical protein